MIKLVCTSDTHFPVDPDMFPDGDVLIHAGDLMYSGYLSEWYERIDALASLPHPLKLFVPGNHDLHIELYPGPALQELRDRGITLVGPPGGKYTAGYKLDNGAVVGGCPYVTDLPRWAFNDTEDNIRDYLDQMGRVDILVAHSPPAGILDRGVGVTGGHYGVGAIRRYIKRFQPQLLICGHVHERYGQQQVDRTLVANVAMCDVNYKMVNPPMVFDIEGE